MKWLLSLVLVLLAVGTLRVVGCGENAGAGGSGGDGGIDLCDQLNCDDHDPCTEDTCDPSNSDFCVFTPVPPGTPCVLQQEGGAEPGVCFYSGECGQCGDSNPDCFCNDANLCTGDAYDPETGCVFDYLCGGLWRGGDPLTNIDGTAFDTGWAICFNVNEDGSALTPSPDCDIDGDDEDAFSFEIRWKDDVGKDHAGEPCNTDDWETDEFGITADVPIEDGSFTIWMADGGKIEGTFDGHDVTGTARVVFTSGMGFGSCELELDEGWIASPFETDCTGQAPLERCITAGEVSVCWAGQCVARDCSGRDDGTTFGIWSEFYGIVEIGACKAGWCGEVEDCTGITDGVLCVSGECSGEACYVWGCRHAEDGTKCFYDSGGQRMFGVCMAGECGPEG
jgi:hypothetical protein